jgi:hypothetical protein
MHFLDERFNTWYRRVYRISNWAAATGIRQYIEKRDTARAAFEAGYSAAIVEAAAKMNVLLGTNKGGK